MAYNVKDIANKILAEASGSDNSGLICNMKLQKILYYMQGFFLAYFDKELFSDEIEAWMYGPVFTTIYEEYKKFENKGILYEGSVIEFLKKEERHLFREVYETYNRYSAVGLMYLTHSEDPWKFTEKKENKVISKNLIKKFFKKKIY